MVYKKYIKLKGKLYGPYYYKNVRIDGKIKNICLGKTPPKEKQIVEKITKSKRVIQKQAKEKPIVKPNQPETIKTKSGFIEAYKNNKLRATFILAVLMLLFFTTFSPSPTGFATYDSVIVKSVNGSFDSSGFISLDDICTEGNLTK